MNGWRRLAVVVAVAWLFNVCAMVLFDFDSIDGKAWGRKRDLSNVYETTKRTPNELFDLKQPIKRLTFVPLDQIDSKNSAAKSKSDTPSWLNEQSTVVHEAQDQSNNERLTFVDLVPTTIVEFRWLYFLLLSFGPIVLFGLAVKTIQWVYAGFRVSATSKI